MLLVLGVLELVWPSKPSHSVRRPQAQPTPSRPAEAIVPARLTLNVASSRPPAEIVFRRPAGYVAPPPPEAVAAPEPTPPAIPPPPPEALAPRGRVPVARGRCGHSDHSTDARPREHSADTTLLERDGRRTQERAGGELEQQTTTASSRIGSVKCSTATKNDPLARLSHICHTGGS